MHHNVKNIFRNALALLAIMLCAYAPSSYALSLSTYADNSVLSEGNWVKVSVPQSGIYMISNADLQKWGFSDPSKVHVYGYGGRRISDVLNSSNYIDDLPIVQSKTTSKGICFYAVGPEKETRSSEGRYVTTLNPFSSVGYYYLSDRDISEIPEITSIGVSVDLSSNDALTTTFIECLHHETNLVNHGETGHIFFGEDFKYTPSQTFNFELPDIVNDEEVWMECQFMTKTLNSTSSLAFTVNGESLTANASDRVPSCSSSAYIHGKTTTTQHTFNISSDKASIGVKISSQATIQKANLDYIALNYTRRIKLRNGIIAFNAKRSAISVEGANSSTNVWDVTTPQKIYSLNTTASNNSVVFKNEYSGIRQYVAWDENSTLPAPTFEGKVSNQNLHNLATPDMVIFTIAEWASQAERVADLHRNSADSLKVVVVIQEDVFNEFSSGAADVNAFRKMLKMFWDRGNENGTPLRYALFMGKGIYDNQHFTREIKDMGLPTMPMWQSDKGLDDNESFCTDDIFAFLKDNSGSNMGSDYYCIAVGRMPVRSFDEAKNAVDKLYKYVNNSPKSEWKNQVMLLADDMDNGVHMTQTESMWQSMSSSTSGSQFLYNKLYIDAFTREGSSYPQARAQMFQQLQEGVVWWNYVGHANTTSWTHDGILSYNDMASLYLKKWPMLYAATCDFLRWDGISTTGAEVMYHLSDGGIIGAISASRPVYIANNGILSNAMAPYIFKRNDDGKFLTIGEIYQSAKNNLRDKGNSIQDRNKLRFALMGDPAMRLAIPTNNITIESINDAYVEFGEESVISARQNAKIKGRITDYSGNTLTNFNGIIHSTIYDAEKSTTSHGYSDDDDGLELVFEEHGSKLYAGRDSIINGEFTINASMPTEIANNYRLATLNLYAVSNNDQEAIGCNRSFYVYGFDTNAPIDSIPPKIEFFYLNNEGFADGDVVNESPMVIAQVSDNIGINLSSAGVGHQMSLRLDGEKEFSDVSLFFTPIIGDTPAGLINYPIENLPDGKHSIRLKVWDTAGNSTEKSIELNVENGIAPQIFDVYTDANPAYSEANFYIRHDRPNAMTTAEIQVYNLMGQLVWKSSKSAQSDMDISSPINWNLCDMAGRRVNRGIYIYKALITTDGKQYSSKSKKIAVAAP